MGDMGILIGYCHLQLLPKNVHGTNLSLVLDNGLSYDVARCRQFIGPTLFYFNLRYPLKFARNWLSPMDHSEIGAKFS
jgi:hypothetical protein